LIKQKEYAKRRHQLMRMAGEESIIILQAAPARIRNNDVHYPYRQDSDFLYLTGFREPGALLVMIPDEGDGHCILFCRSRDPEREMWDGRMVGLEGAVSDFGMDEAFDLKEVDTRLRALLRDRDRIYHDLGRDPRFDQRLIGWLNEFRGEARKTYHAPEEIHALDHMLHDMRVYKSREELSTMRRAAKVAIEAHENAMRSCRPGLNEADIHAGLLQVFTRNQCEPSYLPIVGGGANACVLHYIANRDELKNGELLLIDAGAEYDGYASDITRTFPVNGKFSPEQRELYEVVLAAQSAAIDRARAGNQWQDVHDVAVRVATEGMISLGILQKSLDEEIESRATKVLRAQHRPSGLDVHDVGEYTIDGHSRQLSPAWSWTVEPGIISSRAPPACASAGMAWASASRQRRDHEGRAPAADRGLVRTPDEIKR
jgi:Xaa-Pro aminopeptidase